MFESRPGATNLEKWGLYIDYEEGKLVRRCTIVSVLRTVPFGLYWCHAMLFNGGFHALAGCIF